MKTLSLAFVAILVASTVSASAATTSAATTDGTCPTAHSITRLGEPSNRLDMLREIRSKCAPGDKIMLPKAEGYLVSTACDLNKTAIDLGHDVVCVLSAAPVAKR